MSVGTEAADNADSAVSGGEIVTSHALVMLHDERESINFQPFLFFTLQPLCAVDCSARSTEEQEILVQANVLLAELCSVTCSNSRKTDDRDLWTRRVVQTEKCIYSADAAVARGVLCSVSSGNSGNSGLYCSVCSELRWMWTDCCGEA